MIINPFTYVYKNQEEKWGCLLFNAIRFEMHEKSELPDGCLYKIEHIVNEK